MRGVLAIAAVIGFTLATGAAAQVPQTPSIFGPFAVQPEARTFQIGTLSVTALHDAMYVVPNDGKTFGVDAGADAVGQLLRSAGAPTDRITVSVNVLLVQNGSLLILLDTGLGPKAHGTLLESLNEADVKPERIGAVLITHSHGDHVGGLVNADGRLAFPKATIYMASAEWEWLKTHDPGGIVPVITSRVLTFEPGAQILPGITSVALNGHTPGHVGYEIASGSMRLLDIGDMAHSAIVSLQKPMWAVAFDNDAPVAQATRLATLARLAQDQELIFSPHFPYPGIGHVVAQGDGFIWKPEAASP